MDPADLVNSFATGQYVVTRRTKAATIRGRAQPSGTTPLTITASVQPATGRDLMRLPELRRTVETRVVFTATELVVGGQGQPFEADLISIDNRTWEVQHVESWRISPTADGSYYRCIAQAVAPA